MDIMLVSFSVSNYGPFPDKVEITTEVDSRKKEYLESNTFLCRNSRYNKVSFLYGPNGAGKSNFIKAFIRFQKLIILSPIIASNNPQVLEMKPFKDDINAPINYFKFNTTNKNKPTTFSIELIIDEVLYSYKFSRLDGKIIEEYLTKKSKRTEKILERTSPLFNDIIVKSELSSFKNNLNVVKDNVLCLSIAAFLNNDFAMRIVDAITKIDVISMYTALGSPHLDEEKVKNKAVIDKYLKYLKIADPTLKDLIISFNEEKIDKHKSMSEDFENREFIMKSINVSVESKHNVYENNIPVDEINLPFLQFESNGTVKLFSALPAILDALENGNTLFIDEIENGLHPILTKMIINLFLNTEINPNNAQLICTSHNTILIEEGIRRDQVWFADKDDVGQSKIYRLSDLNLARANENLGRSYLNGIFGSIPNICK